MERHSQNVFKVGLLVLACIGLMAWSVSSITSKRLGQRGYTFEVTFPSAQGLSKGAMVQYAGVAVGEVKDIRLVQPADASIPEAELTVWLPQDLQLHEDVVAQISTFGLLGEKYLELTPMHGEGAIITPNAHMKGVETSSAEAIMQQSSQALVKFNKILDHLTTGQGTVGKLFYTDELHQAMLQLIQDIQRHPWRLFKKPWGEK